VVRTTSAHDGFLVLLDPYYPGWVATVDGQESEIYRADYLFRGVYVPAGERTVRFRYQPLPFRVGAALSLLTALAVVLLLYVLFARALIRLALRLARGLRDRVRAVPPTVPAPPWPAPAPPSAPLAQPQVQVQTRRPEAEAH
jgi:hypothetical protein